MKISIIIPFYRYKEYLRECFQSLKESSFKDFEVLLIKDRVEEDLSDVLEEYRTCLSIRVFELHGKHGVAAARNKGIEESLGEYIYFLDCDDYVLEDTLGQLASFSTNNEDVIYGEIHHTAYGKEEYFIKGYDNSAVEDQGEQKKLRLEKYLENCQRLMLDSTEEKIQAIYHIMKKRKGIKNLTALAALYNRNFLIEKAIRFDESLVYYGDFVFIMEALYKGKFFRGNAKAIYVKRSHPTALAEKKDPLKFMERMNAVMKCRSKIGEKSLLRYLLDRRVVMYYIDKFTVRMLEDKDDRWRHENFIKMAEVLKNCDERVVSDLSGWQTKMVNAIQEEDMQKILKLLESRAKTEKFMDMFKYRK